MADKKAGGMKRFILLAFLLAVIGGLAFWAITMQRGGESNTAITPIASSVTPVSGVSAASKEAWAIRCTQQGEDGQGSAKYCEMVQNISVTRKGAQSAAPQRLIEMAIGYPENGKAVAAIILPLGIQVNKDVRIDVDGKKVFDFAIEFCDAGGCAATFPVNQRLMDGLENGAAMRVHTLAATGQPIVIELTLEGFKEGSRKIKSGKM